jgi:hypothetical protein
VPLTWNVPATRDIDLMVRQAGDAVARGFRNVVVWTRALVAPRYSPV